MLSVAWRLEFLDRTEAVITKSAGPFPKPEDPLPPGSVVDWSVTLRSVAANPALLATIVEAGMEEIPRLVKSIEEAVINDSATDLRLAAHTLKGSLRCFGAAAAVQQAQRLEQMGQEGDLRGAAEALRTLATRTQAVVSSLSEYMQR